MSNYTYNSGILLKTVCKDVSHLKFVVALPPSFCLLFMDYLMVFPLKPSPFPFPRFYHCLGFPYLPFGKQYLHLFSSPPYQSWHNFCLGSKHHKLLSPCWQSSAACRIWTLVFLCDRRGKASTSVQPLFLPNIFILSLL